MSKKNFENSQLNEKSKLKYNDLPKSVHVNEGVTPRVVKWPKLLYLDYYKICQSLGNSITHVTIELVREFVNKNSHVINKPTE